MTSIYHCRVVTRSHTVGRKALTSCGAVSVCSRRIMKQVAIEDDSARSLAVTLSAVAACGLSLLAVGYQVRTIARSRHTRALGKKQAYVLKGPGSISSTNSILPALPPSQRPPQIRISYRYCPDFIPQKVGFPSPQQLCRQGRRCYCSKLQHRQHGQ